MALSDNISTSDLQPSQFQYLDYLISDFLIQNSDSLPSILQNPNCISTDDHSSSPTADLRTPEDEISSISSYISSSDHETVIKSMLSSSSKKITKRKSRTSKHTRTTFITTDAANFRQMVQQVTGVRCCQENQEQHEQFVIPVMNHEPQHTISKTQNFYLPTLDTSAILLYHQEQSSLPQVTTDSIELSTVFDFDCVMTGFPVLDSWKVM